MPDPDRRRAVLADLRARFRSEPHLGPRFHFEAMDWDETGALTLAGEVPSVAAKKRALEVAAAHEAVTSIVDRVHVAPAAPMGDAEIRAQLADYSTGEPAFAGYAVRQQQSFADPPPAAPQFGLIPVKAARRPRG